MPKDPRFEPKDIRDSGGSAWWYEDKRGILVVKQIRDDSGSYIRTDQMRIPWLQILRAAQRSSGQDFAIKVKR